MSEWIAYLSDNGPSSEPITLEELKAQARIDMDLTDDDIFIQSVIIPGARQQAETRSGSIIRPARYRQVFHTFPKDGEPISMSDGLIQVIESITYVTLSNLSNRVALDLATIETINVNGETLITSLSQRWPCCYRSPRAVEITYTAGLESEAFAQRYPSVKVWTLLAAAWAYAQREFYFLESKGMGFAELPEFYLQMLLAPIQMRPRW